MHLAILGNALSFCQLQSCPQPKVSAAALGERFRISIVGILWNPLVTMSTACASKRYIEALNQKPWSILIQCFQCQVCKCTVRTGHMSKPQTLQGRGWSVERHFQLESGLGCTFWKEPKTGRDGRQVWKLWFGLANHSGATTVQTQLGFDKHCKVKVSCSAVQDSCPKKGSIVWCRVAAFALCCDWKVEPFRNLGIKLLLSCEFCAALCAPERAVFCLWHVVTPVSKRKLGKQTNESPKIKPSGAQTLTNPSDAHLSISTSGARASKTSGWIRASAKISIKRT